MSTYSYIYNPKSWLLHFYKCGLLHFKFLMSTYSYILTLKCQVTFTVQIPNINFYTSNRKCRLPISSQIGLIHCHATSQSILIGNNLTRVNKSPFKTFSKNFFPSFLTKTQDYLSKRKIKIRLCCHREP